MNTSLNLAMDQTMEDIRRFVMTQPFKNLLAELWQMPESLRHEFVEMVILDDEELKRRNIIPPNDIQVQRSWFKDGRPTLFCVTKYLPKGLGWQKVTITFDNPITEKSSVGWTPSTSSPNQKLERRINF